MTEKESPFACDMTAIRADQRDAHLATMPAASVGGENYGWRIIKRLFSSVQSVRELSDGYSFQLQNESDTLQNAAQFIELERLCCPFFDFGLAIEREGGAICLWLKGREGVKPFIMAEIGDHLPSEVQH